MKPALASLAGLAVGIVISGLAMLFTGAGHGSYALMPSVASLILAPLSGLAWSWRRREAGAYLGIAAVLSAGLVDVLILAAIMQEGWEYLARVSQVFSLGLVVWGGLMLHWQGLAVAALVVAAARQLKKDGAAGD